MKKRILIECTDKFIEIYTMSRCSVYHKDPKGDDFYFELDEELKALGNALISALSKSRDLSSSNEEIAYFDKHYPLPPSPSDIWNDGSMETLKKLNEEYRGLCDKRNQKWFENNPERRLFEEDLERQRYSEWVDSVLKRYRYKNEKSLLRNMQTCSVTQEKETITFLPFGQREARRGDFTFTLPSISSLEVIGAAVKYSIARCTGRGADLVAKKLFPDGVPATFDDYLASLNLKS